MITDLNAVLNWNFYPYPAAPSLNINLDFKMDLDLYFNLYLNLNINLDILLDIDIGLVIKKDPDFSLDQELGVKLDFKIEKIIRDIAYFKEEGLVNLKYIF